MQQYWAATVVMYTVVIGLMFGPAAFALRPRQTLLLTATGLLGTGATMAWHAVHDPLHSRRWSKASPSRSWPRARLRPRSSPARWAGCDPAAGKPTCIALLDIDLFKQVNDRHGHAAGDEVLRRFAAAARAEARCGDVLARWGGEEFLLMLPDTRPGEALAVPARLRTRAARIGVDGVTPARPVSFSCGLAARVGREPLAATINRADEALYGAKAGGRDRVVESALPG